MLFMVTQIHTPENCPLHEGKGPESLYDPGQAIKLHSAVADVPGHRLVFLLEADSYDAVQDFLEPGRGRCDSEIVPVKDLLKT